MAPTLDKPNAPTRMSARPVMGCGRRSALGSIGNSADLEIGESFGLQGCSSRDAGGDELDVGIRAGFGRVDLEVRQGDAAEIDLDPILRQGLHALVELGFDLPFPPWRAGEVGEKEF